MPTDLDVRVSKLQYIRSLCLLAMFLLPACASSTGSSAPAQEKTAQERQCINEGWQAQTLGVAGLERRVLWQAPGKGSSPGNWSRGAIIVLHGGGGHHYQFCTANSRLVAPQVRFTQRALAEGYAVFLLESTDQVRDNEGRICGKAWDDEVRERPNLDLPFIETVLRSTIPSLRPDGSQEAVFLTGLSSGGYMTVRAATHFGELITAFAPVSSGDPYGWHRVCDKDLTRRRAVRGAGFDNETGLRITEPDACLAEDYPKEKPWHDARLERRPTFRLFHHRYDGIHDFSCGQKVMTQLQRHGYPSVPALVLDGNKRRSLKNHLWQDAYNEPLLEFFSQQLQESSLAPASR